MPTKEKNRRSFETFKIGINMHQNRFQLVKKRNFQNSGSPVSFENVESEIGMKFEVAAFAKPQLTLKFIWFECVKERERRKKTHE